MLHYVHQLVTDFVCLLFGAGQVVYSEFIKAFLFKTAARCKQLMRAVRVNPNSKAAGCKTKTMSWQMLKRCAELRGTVKS